jgi:hypothetical protein
MGFPPRGWYAHETQGSGYFADIQGTIPPLDPSYVDDFWSRPGYLGSDPASSIHAERFQFETTVTGRGDGPAGQIELAGVPDRPIVDAHLVLLDGPHAGRSLAIARAQGSAISLANTSDPDLVAAIRSGDRVRIDNSWPLALQTYHRHQVPPDPAEYGWNQFRDAAGQPLYPQRDLLIGHIFAVSAIGSLLSGRIAGKMLLVQSLMDIDAVPWFADWYRSEVGKALGSRRDDDFALWFIDHTQHDNPHTAIARAHTVKLGGALQHGLRDLARWVEQGVKPSETVYRVADGQVEVPDTAAARKGVQPVVTLKVNGSVRTEVAAGEPVTFSGVIEVPAGAGHVVAAEWDFAGVGEFTETAVIPSPTTHAPTARVKVTASHAYAEPGTYFPVLRAAAQREGDARSPHCRVENLARARVVVV